MCTPRRPGRSRFATGVAVTVTAALSLGATVSAAGAITTNDHGQRKPVIRSVAVKPSGSAGRAVTVVTGGRRFQLVFVCDLKATLCVRATHAGPHRWRALVPATDPRSRYEIGVIARSGHDYVTAGYSG